MTIGDSFSNGGGGGSNPFYQDYIATIYEYDVLNVRTLPRANDGIIETVLALEQSGLLDEMAPRLVVLQCGGRDFDRRLSGDKPWVREVSREALLQQLAWMKPKTGPIGPLEYVPFINTANYKILRDGIGYRFKPCLENDVCRVPLDRPLFSVPDSRTLAFYRDDVGTLDRIDASRVGEANRNLNRLAGVLASKGIALFVLVAADKYDMYSDFVVATPFPRNPVFDLLEAQSRDYRLINSKKILLPLLRQGEQDLYFADDTHWSSKGAEEIVRRSPFASALRPRRD